MVTALDLDLEGDRRHRQAGGVPEAAVGRLEEDSVGRDREAHHARGRTQRQAGEWAIRYEMSSSHWSMLTVSGRQRAKHRGGEGGR